MSDLAPVRYGQHVRAGRGTACLICGSAEQQPVTDHCHLHGWVRGPVCQRCNILMAAIDRRRLPSEAALSYPLTLAGLVAHVARCPDCGLFGVDDLSPALPPDGPDRIVTYPLRWPAWMASGAALAAKARTMSLAEWLRQAAIEKLERDRSKT